MTLAGQGMAVVSLATTVLNDIDIGLPKALVGTLSLLLAIAAFVVVLKDGSTVVSASLLAKGLIDTAIAAASTKSGAKIGLAFGIIVLAFGVLVALITIRSARRRTASPGGPGAS